MNEGLGDLVGFGRYLRSRGLPVGTGRILSFCQAVGILGPSSTDDIYWAGRTTLVSSKQHLSEFDRAFEAWFITGELQEPILKQKRPARVSPEGAETEAVEMDAGAWLPADDGAPTEGEMAARIAASDVERLRNKSFEELTDVEQAQSAALIRELSVRVPVHRTRRLRPSSKGDRFDIRRTLRHSLRTQGEPIRRAWRDRRSKPRPLVLILDVSGSMSAYSRALLQFGFAAKAAGHKVEVFCFGTRLTRVTRSLLLKDPNRAMKSIGDLVRDWDGGTRIGDSIHELLGRFGQHGFLRGSVVVLCSDGLERGDPELLAAEMERLARFAHRVVWVNPLKGDPAYEPTARGMAAALPYIDDFHPGHDLASLERLSELLGN
jgi:uncharacterized protein with von Willebrand factor type A (vWA) domain